MGKKDKGGPGIRRPRQEIEVATHERASKPRASSFYIERHKCETKLPSSTEEHVVPSTTWTYATMYNPVNPVHPVWFPAFLFVSASLWLVINLGGRL